MALLTGMGPEGTPILSVLAKKTYRLVHGQLCAWSENLQVPLYRADVWGKAGTPLEKSLLHESDLVPFKKKIDVLVRAKAHAPLGRKVRRLNVALTLGKNQHTLLVWGHRRLIATPLGLKFSDPEPFESLDLDYAYAFGGTDEISQPGLPQPYPANPIGKGYLAHKSLKTLHNLSLPNIEFPEIALTPQTLAGKQIPIRPAGFSPIPKNFYPRFTHVGPDHFPTPDFFQAAPAFLQREKLAQGEPLRFLNMDRDRCDFHTYLPLRPPAAQLLDGNRERKSEMVLQTLEIHKEKNLLTQVWRASFSLEEGPLEDMPQLLFFVIPHPEEPEMKPFVSNLGNP